MPTILAFDTSGPFCAVAILHKAKIVSSVKDMRKGQAEHLMPFIRDIMADNTLRFDMLDAIGVGIGPGNFTGIRIAVSAARGMALGLNIPAVGVSGFEANSLGHTRPVTVAIPAPRDQYYIQTIFDNKTSNPSQVDSLDEITPLSNPEPKIAVENIAQIAAERYPTSVGRPAPLYIRSADAVPASASSPVILP